MDLGKATVVLPSCTGSLQHSAAASELRVTIQQMSCQFNMPAGAEYPVAISNRLADLVHSRVTRACGAALESLATDDDAVYRIKRLELDLWIDMQRMSESQIAVHWGQSLAVHIARAMQQAGPQQVVRFDSPRHFITAFLRDLIDGWAWGRWYYAEFQMLKRLPVPAIAAQLLTTRPGWIVPVLTDLAATGHATRLIGRMRVNEITQLWTALGHAPQPALAQYDGVNHLLKELVAAWPDIALSHGMDATSRARDRLMALVALAKTRPDFANDSQAASLIHALVDLAALMNLDPDLGMLLAMKSSFYPAALRRVAGSQLADVLTWLAPLSTVPPGREYLAQLAEAADAIWNLGILQGSSPDGVPTHEVTPISSGDVSPAAPEGEITSDVSKPGEGKAPGPQGMQTETAGRSRRIQRLTAQMSEVGSVFLLAPALVELGLWELWQGEVGEEAARRYLFVAALKSLGRGRAPLHLGDSMLAAFAGLDKPPVADSRVPMQTDATPGRWPTALPEVSTRWYPTHERNLAQGEVQGIDVLRDFQAAHWLAAHPSEHKEAPFSSADCWSPVVHDPAGIRPEITDEEQALLTREAAHLQLGRRMGYPWLTPSLDASLSAATSLLLRRAAARLPRLGMSSPSYFAAQFLSQPATLHPGPDAITVQLAGGPLSTVLRMAGLPDLIEVPWLPLPLRLTLPPALGV